MECQRCGICCHFQLRIADGKYWIGRGGGDLSGTNFPCWFLRYREDGLAMCLLFDNDMRPKICGEFFCDKAKEADGCNTMADTDGLDSPNDEHNESPEAEGV